MYYPLNKRQPEWGVALGNESFSRVMKLVWNKESGSNIKLCPITIITDLSIGWEGGYSRSSGPIQTYRLDNNLELMSSIMECRQRRKKEGGGGGVGGGRHVFTRGKKKTQQREKGAEGETGKEDRLDGEEGRRQGTRKTKERRGRNECRDVSRSHVEKRLFCLTFSLPPSLSLYRTEERGDDIFICSFKGSLLSPFKRNLSPFVSVFFSLAPPR